MANLPVVFIIFKWKFKSRNYAIGKCCLISKQPLSSGDINLIVMTCTCGITEQ